MNYIVAASTDIGSTKSINQDSLSIRVIDTRVGKMVFAVLCDGLGGLSRGELASATLVHAFNRWTERGLPKLCSRDITDEDIRSDWSFIISEYNEKIKRYGKENSITLGTTVTAMLITASRYYIVNVGDTRAYEITDKVKLLTRDQTVAAREAELFKLTPQEAETDRRRHILLQCIGASDNVYPELFFGATLVNSVYMLCSDGFRHEIKQHEIFEYLKPDVMTQSEVMKLNMDKLIEVNKQRLEKDNISALSIRTF